MKYDMRQRARKLVHIIHIEFSRYYCILLVLNIVCRLFVFFCFSCFCVHFFVQDSFFISFGAFVSILAITPAVIRSTHPVHSLPNCSTLPHQLLPTSSPTSPHFPHISLCVPVVNAFFLVLCSRTGFFQEAPFSCF